MCVLVAHRWLIITEFGCGSSGGNNQTSPSTCCLFYQYTQTDCCLQQCAATTASIVVFCARWSSYLSLESRIDALTWYNGPQAGQACLCQKSLSTASICVCIFASVHSYSSHQQWCLLSSTGCIQPQCIMLVFVFFVSALPLIARHCPKIFHMTTLNDLHWPYNLFDR